MTKAEQRQEIRQRLARFTPAERQAASLVIAQKVLALPAFRAAQVVALYTHLASEPETFPLFQAATQMVVLPRVDTVTKRIDFYRVRAWSELIPGAFGVREPDPQCCSLIPVAEIEFILVPGMAFDRHGWRLGRGGGFYDRVLEQLPKSVPRVGAFFACQELPQVAQEAHDQPLNTVITELS